MAKAATWFRAGWTASTSGPLRSNPKADTASLCENQCALQGPVNIRLFTGREGASNLCSADMRSHSTSFWISPVFSWRSVLIWGRAETEQGRHIEKRHRKTGSSQTITTNGTSWKKAPQFFWKYLPLPCAVRFKSALFLGIAFSKVQTHTHKKKQNRKDTNEKVGKLH